MIDILIPMCPDRYMPESVLKSIIEQGVLFNLFLSNSRGDGAANARNHVLNLWKDSTHKSEYVLTTDNDLLLPDDSLNCMILFLRDNRSFGAIALHRNQTPTTVLEDDHINAGPVLYRSEVLEQITYHNNLGCECMGMSRDVREAGWRIGYLPNWRYSHIEDTRLNHG